MTRYQFHDDSGSPIDSYFEVHSSELILHSRGGKIGSVNARNTQYSMALRMLLERIDRSELTLSGVWVDSSIARRLPIAQRAVFFPEDADVSPNELLRRLSDRMAAVGRAPTASRGKGNSTKRLRFAFAAGISDERIARVAGRGKTGHLLDDDERLPAATFDQVGADHIWHAVERLLAGEVSHPFGESMNHDVLADNGERLPPKAVFGLAATVALGFDVRPRHFKSGPGTRCFREIYGAGYRIVPKGEQVQPRRPPPDPEERSWIEGNPKLVSHLRRERGTGISRAKKEAFKREHGRLYCERCNLDPEEVYGRGIGEACIEVHHILPLEAGKGPRKTNLTDLMCVCANCHRTIHYGLSRNS